LELVSEALRGTGLAALEAVEAVFYRLDSSDQPIDLHAFSNALATVRAGYAPGTPENAAVWAEMVAFNLSVEADAQGPFYRYFAPISAVQYEGGQIVYSPDPRDDPAAVVAVWQSRRDQSVHPLLVARFADLMWTLGPLLTGTRPDPANARLAARSYLEADTLGLFDHPHERATGVLRAASLATAVRDNALRDDAASRVLALHGDGLERDGYRYLSVVDELLWGRSVPMSDGGRAEVIAGLEAKLASSSDPANANFNPFEAEEYAQRLQRYYQRQGDRPQFERVNRSVGEAFEAHAASDAGGLAASANLESASLAYQRAGDKAAVERVRIAKVAAVEDSIDSMSVHEHRVEIPREQVEEFLARLVDDDVSMSLARLAARFVDRVSIIETSVREGAKTAPLQAILTMQVMEDDHVAAVIGSVDEDLEGRVMQDAGRRLTFDQFWLDRAFQRLDEVHHPDPNDLVGWANRLGAFPEGGLLRSGIVAWQQGDWVKAMHVLVPQIEVGLRNILRGVGGAIVKPHPQGGGREVLLNFGELLNAERLRDALGPDLLLYFRAVYSDPRAWNLRNAVAHGLAGLGRANYATCNMLMHSVLVLGCWTDIANSRQRMAEADREAGTNQRSAGRTPQ
jgi:hypothetical protein